jgi:hypothetical protein
VPHRQSVQELTVRLPLGQKLIHQSYEPRIVRWFEQMNHLVDDDIFKAFDRLSGEISIRPKGACPRSSIERYSNGTHGGKT